MTHAMVQIIKDGSEDIKISSVTSSTAMSI